MKNYSDRDVKPVGEYQWQAARRSVQTGWEVYPGELKEIGLARAINANTVWKTFEAVQAWAWSNLDRTINVSNVLGTPTIGNQADPTTRE